MVCSRREPRSHSTGTRWIWDSNSVFMALLITNSDIILEVRHGPCHFVLVWLLVFSSLLSLKFRLQMVIGIQHLQTLISSFIAQKCISKGHKLYNWL
jgi:hypothetical protein